MCVFFFSWLNWSLEHHLPSSSILSVPCYFFDRIVWWHTSRQKPHTHTPEVFRQHFFLKKKRALKKPENLFELACFGTFNLSGIKQTLHKSPLGYELNMHINISKRILGGRASVSCLKIRWPPPKEPSSNHFWITQFLTSKFECPKFEAYPHGYQKEKHPSTSRSDFFQISKASFLESIFWNCSSRSTTGVQAIELRGCLEFMLHRPCGPIYFVEAKICVDGDTPGRCCCFSPWCSTERNGCVRIRVRNCCLPRRRVEKDPTPKTWGSHSEPCRKNGPWFV